MSSMKDWQIGKTTRGLCECVANSLTCTVLNTAMGGGGGCVQDYCNHWNSLNSVNLVLRSEKSSSSFLLIYSHATHLYQALLFIDSCSIIVALATSLFSDTFAFPSYLDRPTRRAL